MNQQSITLPPSHTVSVRMLERLGYRVCFRAHGWTECLVCNETESWEGRGTSDEQALRDTLRQMLPSCLGQTTFEAWVTNQTIQQRAASTIAEMLGNETASPVASLPAKDPSTPLESFSSFGFLEEDAPTKTPPAITEGSPSSVPTAKKETSTEVPLRADPERDPLEPSLAQEEALEHLASIESEIGAEMSELGLMSATCQRLQIASWIFHARALQEARPRDRAVSDRVHVIALRLTDACKLYWPGSVRALQVATHPTQALEGIVPGPFAYTWREAAMRVEEHLEHVLSAAGRDDWGWRDRIVRMPPDPMSVLAEAVGKIEGVLGSLGVPADVRRKHLANNVITDSMEELLLAAHLLRWCRRGVPDGIQWGTAMGALRWAAHMVGRDGVKLRGLIDEFFLPSSDWAQLLGRDPKVLQERRLQHRVLTQVPSTASSTEELIAWLEDAFGVLTNPQIAKLLPEIKERVLSLSEDAFAASSRSVRSRLRRLHSILRQEQDPDVELPEVGEVPLEESDAVTAVAAPSTFERLLQGVRPHVVGKRVLVVSNRDDENLQAQLEKDLGCKVAVRNAMSVHRAQGIASSVQSGAYDLVLFATSFLGHGQELVLSRAARSVGVPYVRVAKGRPLATVRALARFFEGVETVA